MEFVLQCLITGKKEVTAMLLVHRMRKRLILISRISPGISSIKEKSFGSKSLVYLRQ